MTKEEIITDEEITKVWQYANFGSVPKRTVILEALEHCVRGYRTGRTAECIVTELGLINGKWALTDKGLQYLKACYSDTATLSAIRSLLSKEYPDGGEWLKREIEKLLGEQQ